MNEENAKKRAISLPKSKTIPPISERFLAIIEYLGITGYALSKQIPDITPSKLSHIKNGRNEPSKPIMSLFLKQYSQINPEWLLTGEGNMLKEGETVNEVRETEVKYSKPQNIIPLYDNVTTIGGTNITADMQGVSEASEYINTGDWFREATAAIRHYGDSMIEYPPGCILALRELKERQLVIWGRDYVIETSEYRITKCVQRGYDNEHITAYSSNNETYPDGRLKHEPVDVAWSDIRKIFLVLGYVVKKNGGTIVFGN
jgi:hypothetical protein